MAERPRPRRAVKVLATSQALSWLGDSLVPVALSVGVLKGGASAADLGLILATGMVCRLAFMLVGGVWADRLGPRRVMVAADIARAVVQLLLAMELVGGDISVSRVAILVGLTNVGAALFGPAFLSFRGAMVSPAERQSANGLFTVLRNTAALGGPALAGVLVVYPGPAAAFVVNALTFVLSALLLGKVVAGGDRVAAQSTFRRNLREGWSEAVATRWYLRNLTAHGCWNMASGAMAIIGPVLAMRHLGGPAAVATVAAATALGGVAGGLIATRARLRRPLIVGNLGAAVPSIAVLAYLRPGTLLWVSVASFVGRVSIQFLNVCWETVVQNAFPADKLARVSSWDMLVSFAAVPLGNYLAGGTLATLGESATLTILALIMAASGIVPAVQSYGDSRRTHSGASVDAT